ncbi:MAG: ATP/GTP-binding protein [Methyloprofundus sp.]|nr:ATP/GTP-binding protein [Methyloprofundus sp.]
MPQKQIKIIFTGSVGAGKTQAISQLSEVPVISTDTKYTEGKTGTDKKTTTIAMDYGQISLSSTEKLHLYGTPGQRRFDFMSEVLCIGGLALVIMIDNSTEDPFIDLNYYLKLNERFLKKNPAVIAITHTDLSTLPSLNDYQQFLAKINLDFLVMKMDTRQRDQVVDVLEAVVSCLESQLI